MISIGVVNFNKDNSIPIKLITELANRGYAVYMIHHYDDYVNIIKKMDEITYWFFSGSEFMPNHNKSPQLDKEILKIKDKKFMMVCYSMEIFCKLLEMKLDNYNDSIKKISKFHDAFLGKTIEGWRNHKYYLSEKSAKDITILGTLENEVMTAKYTKKSDFLLVQWHPPYTDDGKELLTKWLSS